MVGFVKAIIEQFLTLNDWICKVNILSEHGANPQTTHVAGNVGYLAPELTRTRRATTYTDVFAFGAFMLEVACGRRPIEVQGLTEQVG